MQSLINEQEIVEFNAVFPDILKCLMEDVIDYEDALNKPASRFKQAIEYNVPHGEKSSSLVVIETFKQLCGSDKIDENELYLIQVMAWCVELLRSCVFVQFDLINQSKTRSNQPCWYKKHKIGLSAINDAIMLKTGMYGVLKMYFKDKSYYPDILDLFQEMTLKVAIGRSYASVLSPPSGELQFDKFNMETYAVMTNYTFSYYGFYFPIALAMHVKGITQKKLHVQTQKVALEIGNLIKIQNDYIDWYVDPSISGKIGNDIESGKCTWLIVKALELANSQQIAIIRENYGRKDPKCIAKIKKLFEELEIRNYFTKIEDELFENIKRLIDEIDFPLLRKALQKMTKALDKIKQ